MATNKIPMNIVVRQMHNDENTSDGRWFGEILSSGTLTTRGIAKHMVEHGSTFGLSTIVGVLTALSQCVPELLSEGIGVKISGLGAWYPMLDTNGADSPEKFKVAKHVNGIHIRFLPDSCELDNVTSKQFRKLCQMSVFGTVESEILPGGKRRKKVYSYVQQPDDEQGDIVNP